MLLNFSGAVCIQLFKDCNLLPSYISERLPLAVSVALICCAINTGIFAEF